MRAFRQHCSPDSRHCPHSPHSREHSQTERMKAPFMQEQRMFSAEPHRELILIDSESNNRISVLLLDSDPNHAEELTRSLQALGYGVTTRSDIISVLHGLSNSDFDILIVSSNRPGEWKTYVTRIHKTTRRAKRFPPRILCLARVYRGPQERLDAERLGVRLIYER